MSTASATPQLPRVNSPRLRPLTERVVHIRDVNMEIGQNTDPLIVGDRAAILQQIMNVLGVRPGEEQFEPTFGSFLPYRLFEEVSERTAFLIRFDTIEALRTFMTSKIVVLLPQCDIKEMADGDGYSVLLAYRDLRRGEIEREQIDLPRPIRS